MLYKSQWQLTIYDGRVMDSTGKIVWKWTTREMTDSISIKSINASNDAFYGSTALAA